MESHSSDPSPGETSTWSDPSPHSSTFLDVNGVRLQCLDWGGAGPDLILIHGASESPHLFDDFAPAFTDVFRVLAYARRGHGRSESKGPFDTKTLTEDLRCVMDALGIRRAHLAGHSMGGNEITAMAGSHPERVDRLVYIEAGYDWGDPRCADAFRSFPPHVTRAPAGLLSSIDAYRASFREMFPAVDDVALFEGWMRDTVVIQPDGSLRPTRSDRLSEALLASLLSERRDYTRVRAPALAIYTPAFWDVQHGDPTYVAENAAWEQRYFDRFRTASIERVRRELSGVEILMVPGTHPDLIYTCRKKIVRAMRRFLGVPASVARGARG